MTYQGQVVTNAEAWFNNSLHPRKPEGLLGWTAQDGHLDSHTALELCYYYYSQLPNSNTSSETTCVLNQSNQPTNQ